MVSSRPGKGGAAPRRVTLRDVAARAGVSIWTASNTFSNPERVAEATRQRVLAAADEMGFSGPNPGARSLALGRTGMIALVAPGEAEALLADGAAAQVARGLLTVCDRTDLSLVLTGHADGRMVDGRVFFRSPGPAPVRGPAVLVDGDGASDLPWLGADVRAAGAALARHLHALGHRRIAVISRPGAESRLDGVAEGWPEPGPLPVFSAGGARSGAARGDIPPATWPTEADGEAAARAALGRTPRPTALLALSDTLAAGALEAAHFMGLRVPADVSIAGLDDLPGSDARGLTTAFVPYRALGELAGAALAARLQGTEAEPVPPLPTHLVVRATTAPPREPPA